MIDLGKLSFPPELLEYIRTGPTFDPEKYLAATANELVQNLSTSRIGEECSLQGLLVPLLFHPRQTPIPFPMAGVQLQSRTTRC